MFVIFLVVLFAGYTLPLKTLFDKLHNNSIWKVEGSKYIFLTFDDGINKKVTPYLLKQLDKGNHKATFFLIPEYVTKEDIPILKKIIKAGHTIGLHGSSRFLCFRSPSYLLRYIRSFEGKISSYLGTNFKVRYFRPPSGWRSPHIYMLLKNLGIVLVGWSAFCWPDVYVKSDTEIIKRFRKHVAPGRIFVLHDGVAGKKDPDREDFRRALPEMMKILRSKELRSKAISDLE